LPRKAPSEVIEQRITFGTYERQFVTEIKNDIEKSVKVAAVTTVTVPVVLGASIVTGLGLLGYGIYRGMDAFGSLSDVVETAGCAFRKYARSTLPFGHYYIDDCEVASIRNKENSDAANAANERKRQRRRDEEEAARKAGEPTNEEKLRNWFADNLPTF